MRLTIRIFKAAAPLPAVCLAAMFWALSREEGWGAWALAASLGPLVVLFSAVMTALGAGLWIYERRTGRRGTSTLVATIVAAVPLVWFLGRVAYLELIRSW